MNGRAVRVWLTGQSIEDLGTARNHLNRLVSQGLNASSHLELVGEGLDSVEAWRISASSFLEAVQEDLKSLSSGQRGHGYYPARLVFEGVGPVEFSRQLGQVQNLIDPERGQAGIDLGQAIRLIEEVRERYEQLSSLIREYLRRD